MFERHNEHHGDNGDNEHQYQLDLRVVRMSTIENMLHSTMQSNSYVVMSKHDNDILSTRNIDAVWFYSILILFSRTTHAMLFYENLFTEALIFRFFPCPLFSSEVEVFHLRNAFSLTTLLTGENMTRDEFHLIHTLIGLLRIYTCISRGSGYVYPDLLNKLPRNDIVNTLNSWLSQLILL